MVCATALQVSTAPARPRRGPPPSRRGPSPAAAPWTRRAPDTNSSRVRCSSTILEPNERRPTEATVLRSTRSVSLPGARGPGVAPCTITRRIWAEFGVSEQVPRSGIVFGGTQPGVRSSAPARVSSIPLAGRPALSDRRARSMGTYRTAEGLHQWPPRTLRDPSSSADPWIASIGGRHILTAAIGSTPRSPVDPDRRSAIMRATIPR